MAIEELKEKNKLLTPAAGGWARAKRQWDEEHARDRNGHRRGMPLHIIAGAVLPVLPAILGVLKGSTARQCRIMRVETTDGKLKVVGVAVPHKLIDRVRAQARCSRLAQGGPQKNI